MSLQYGGHGNWQTPGGSGVEDALFTVTSTKKLIVGSDVSHIPDNMGSKTTESPLEDVTEVIIPDSVKTMGSLCFYAYRNVLGLVIPEGVTSIGFRAFDGWSSAQTLTLPNTLTTLGARAFDGWSEFEGELVIPGTITSMGERCFSEWYLGASTLVIEEGLKVIPRQAFASWETAVSAEIPSTIETIEYGAFDWWSQAELFTCHAVVPPAVPDGVLGYTSEEMVIRVPAGSVSAYKAATGWSDYAAQIQAI